MLPQYLERWGIDLKYGIRKVVTYAQERPTKILGYFQNALRLSDADMEKYFGAAIEKIREGAAKEQAGEAAQDVLGEGGF